MFYGPPGLSNAFALFFKAGGQIADSSTAVTVQQDEEDYAVGDNEDFAADNDGDMVVESGQRPNGAGVPAEANKERVTTPYMTKYEKARILGTRALQIRCVPRRRFMHLLPDSRGAEPCACLAFLYVSPSHSAP